ncbi:glutamate synthase [NADPH] small chain [Oceanobacillus oncorhynchi subsp. incaldanensis]|uniref:glutamate synthase subunit beta n=1 Tax=Oceanobacillus TaxID=182709 RepID=UPI001B054E93|nr:glutamate synthase subunit beta [Oceanobacillus oncorhynchi]UUI38176.1 glutamate synthase subunit beta [Oceanobacillus oncorhynchi]GIO17114.1 glutamate synthase [NADPH] small chain [Oceanobacillus oncorhynchi subsp. incaldanensis]
MGKATGFMEIKRKKATERDPLERIKDWKEYAGTFSDDAASQQGARCMDCSIPFCHIGMEIEGATSGCPVYNLIPEWNDLVYKGRWREALDRLMKTNNFPEFTGRVCPAPCEGSCTVAINDPAVSIKNIEQKIIDKGFEEGWIEPRIPEVRTGKKIAVIGSGPAGLAAADQLNQAGHEVTIYERADRAGGLLTYGIPNMKLDKGVVERRIQLLRQEGIHFVLNTEVGKDISAEDMKASFDSVIICTGAQKHRDLPLEGRDGKGIRFAMDYLTRSTKKLLDADIELEEELNAEGKDVIVIGGGDTGADCIATALRQGAKSIVQFGKHPQLPVKRADSNQWPAYPQVFSLEYAHKEAKEKFRKDIREYSIQTQKFVTDAQGNLKELHTIQMEKKQDENGVFFFEEIPGTEKVWPAQLVLIAIGFEGAEETAVKAFEVKTMRNRVLAAYGKFLTTEENVFTAGDARRGQSLIVWAINEGREAAYQVDEYLMGTTSLPTVANM